MLTSTDDERKAAEEAKAVLRSLVPSSPRSEAKLSIVRNAANVATNAIQKFSGEKDLNVARFDALMALEGVCGLLGKRFLVQGVIDRAQRAVEAWVNALGAG